MIQKKEEMLEKVRSYLKEAPEGTLKYQNRDGVTYYFRQRKNLKTEKWEKTYLKRTQEQLIKELAQKSYFQKVSRVLEKQLQALHSFQDAYNEFALEEIYNDLPKERRILTEPLLDGVQMRLKEWEEEEYKTYEGYLAHKLYETDRGELVRSKSEVIIANLLYRYQKELDYKYERPLRLYEKERKAVTIHPDFTILNKKTGKIYYYEHAGRMDDARYVADFVSKINLYTANDILPGRDLLVSFETIGVPLSIQCVKKVIESVLDEE